MWAEAVPSTGVGAGRYAAGIRRSGRHARTIMAPRRIDAEAHRESRRLPLVMLQQPAEPLVAFDIVRAKDAHIVWRLGHLRREVPERLMRARRVAAGDVFLDQVAQVLLAEVFRVAEQRR